MSRLKRVIVEVHRRSLWQVLGIYLVGSWIGYEVILALTEGVGLPDWVPAFAIVLFIVGLPIVLATAFVQEGIGSRGRPAEPVAEPADDSAVAVHERYVSTPDSRRIWSDNFFLPRAHERLAELYQTKGDLAKAASHAARFVELWQDADAELQPRVRAKQELLARLQERR
jgi:hypothetical protein